MIKSHSLVRADFKTEWYKRWAKELLQDKDHLDNHALYANKFWQNAVMVQALWERRVIREGATAIGFGVGQERLPALFAKYGVRVMATDQSFGGETAKHWEKYELANDVYALNRLGICPKKKFLANTRFTAVDMRKVPKKFHGKYDFLWSNCALGHLGTLELGAEFIEDSLDCLKPGGWAVHTTELNALSNRTTNMTGSTIVFRLNDLYKLMRRLTKRGYVCSPLIFDPGQDAEDRRIAINPQYGNDFSKLQVMGQLASQVVLIIHKPLQPPTAAQRLKANVKLRRAYLASLFRLTRYVRGDQTLRAILRAKKAPLSALSIQPVKPERSVTVKKGKQAELFIDFKNKSTVPLFSLYARLGMLDPVVMGTTKPADRESVFAEPTTWVENSKNRAAHTLYVRRKGEYVVPDHVEPGQDFAMRLVLNAKGVTAGTYDEAFSLVQEHRGWLESSEIRVRVKVT